MPIHVTTTTAQTLSNKGFSGPTRFDGNVTIFGDLSCNGTQTFNNTIFSTTSAVSVVHVGDGPALWVGNNGTGDIASFYDIDSNVEVFHVGGNNGTFPNVGVKTSTPNVDFTVNGAISASSTIYDTSGNSNQWNNAYTTVQTNSAAWSTGGAYLPLSGGTLTGTLSVASGGNRTVLSNTTLAFANSSSPNNTSSLTRNSIEFTNGNSTATLTPTRLDIQDVPDGEGRNNAVVVNYNGGSGYLQVRNNFNYSGSLNVNSLDFNTDDWSVSLQPNANQGSGSFVVYLPDNNGTLLTNVSANLWNKTYSTVQTNSATNWNYQGTDVKSLTSNWQNTYTNFSIQSANNASVFSTVQTNSASWGTGGGSGVDTGVRALTANWQSTYTTVQANSSTWGTGGGGTPAVSYSRWQLIGANSTTVYSISGATMTAPEAYRVTINSIIQDPAVYTIDASADTITFSSVPPLSSDIIVIESAITATSASGGGGSITNSATPPVSPNNGDLWFNTENGILYVYYTDDDGSQWVAPDNGGDGGGVVILLASATASNNAEILFDNVFNPSLYCEYTLRFQGVRPATDTVQFLVQLRDSVPVNIADFHRNNINYGGISVNTAGNVYNAGGTTGWAISQAAGNGTNEIASGELTIMPVVSNWTTMRFSCYFGQSNSNDRYGFVGAGACEGTTAPAGVRIYMSSGNISIGTFQLYGIKK